MPASLGHVKLPVGDLAASRRFYAGALAPLGFELVYDSTSSLGFGPPPFELFAVEVSHEPILGVHVAFDAADRASVDAFHAAALAAGGRDNGAPGLRPQRSFPNDHAARPVIADGARAEPALLTVGAAESAPFRRELLRRLRSRPRRAQHRGRASGRTAQTILTTDRRR